MLSAQHQPRRRRRFRFERRSIHSSAVTVKPSLANKTGLARWSLEPPVDLSANRLHAEILNLTRFRS